jgi:hypothetical protein
MGKNTAIAETTETETPQAISAIDEMLQFLPGTEVLMGLSNQSNPQTEVEDQEPTEDTEAEAEDTTEETTDTGETVEDEDDGETNAEQSTNATSGSQKRIDKLTSRAKSAEERLAAVEQELAAARAAIKAPSDPAPSASTANAISQINTFEDLDKLHTNAMSIKEWAIQHLDGGEITNPDGTKDDLDAEQVRRLLARADRLVTGDIPRRAREIQDRTAYLEHARTVYPDFYEADGGEAAKEFANVRGYLEAKGFGSFPDLDLIAARYLAGERLERSTAAAKTTTEKATTTPAARKPTAKLPPQEPRPSGAVPQAAGANKQRALAAVADSSGAEEELTAYFMQTDRAA